MESDEYKKCHIATISDKIDIYIYEYQDRNDYVLQFADFEKDIFMAYELDKKEIENIRYVLTWGANSKCITDVIKENETPKPRKPSY